MICSYQAFGDILEVLWSDADEVMFPLDQDGVSVRVDPEGNVIGFQVLGLRAYDGKVIEIPTASISDQDSVA